LSVPSTFAHAKILTGSRQLSGPHPHHQPPPPQPPPHPGGVGGTYIFSRINVFPESVALIFIPDKIKFGKSK